MLRPTPAVLAQIPLFRRVGADDRNRVVEVSHLRTYARGESVFQEGDDSDFFLIVVTDRVKVFKRTPAGNDRILDLFGPGGPLGAVAAYEARPYPASAEALEETTCLAIPRQSFFTLLEQHPSLVRGLLGSLSHRLVELTARLTELTGGRIESRFARLFLKLGDQMGRPDPARGGLVVPMALSRQELADLTGTTIETSIRIMSHWNKEGVLLTERDGFVIVDLEKLKSTAEA